MLIVPFPESALNEHAGKMFMEAYEDYCKHAKLLTELHAMPKELKALENNVNKSKSAQEEEKLPQPSKKENDNKKKWMKRI